MKQFNEWLKGLNWASCSFWFGSNLAKFAYLFPIVGYLVLASDYFVQHMTYEDVSKGGWGWIESSKTRLQFIYFGLVAMGVSQFIYFVRRPRVLKFGSDQYEYSEFGFNNFDMGDFARAYEISPKGDDGNSESMKDWWEGYQNEAHGQMQQIKDTWKSSGLRAPASAPTFEKAVQLSSDFDGAKTKYKLFLKGLLIQEFLAEIETRKIALGIALVFALLGHFLLMIPSVDLFVRVATSTLPTTSI